MASTYDNSLRLELIATGEAASTWGDKTNVNLTAIAAAFGYATQDGFAADANATTTVADGAADPARALYFKITSSATLTATRTLTIAPNTISRVMWIENATTGSQSIAISQGSGANVTIPAGKTAVVYLDGAGAGAAVVDAMASLNIDGSISAGAATFSGNVGIGGSPSKRLHVFGPDGAGEGTPTFNANTVAVFQNNGTSADGTILNIVSGSASSGFIGFGNSTDDIRQAIVANMADDSLQLRTGNNSTALTIDSAGNVGVGVTPETWQSAYNVLQIGAGGSITASSTNPSRTYVNANIYQNASNVASYIATDEASQYFQNGGTHIFNVAPSGTADSAISWTTAATIDNSGNLLVGTTSTSSTLAGLVMYGGASKGVTTQTYAGRPSYINRLSTDGDIIEFARDNVTVASIGVSGGNNLYISGLAASHSGLTFATNQILPSAVGAITDGAESLGNSSSRFKDLYLSSGVYLGGTGAANKLDDYEEGTWTPAFSFDVGGTGIVYGSRAGKYTKVGNAVHVSFIIVVNSGVGTNDYWARLSDIPFVGNGTNHFSGRVRLNNTGSANFNISVEGGTDTLLCYHSNGTSDYARGDHIIGQQLSGSFTYYTNS